MWSDCLTDADVPSVLYTSRPATNHHNQTTVLAPTPIICYHLYTIYEFNYNSRTSYHAYNLFVTPNHYK